MISNHFRLGNIAIQNKIAQVIFASKGDKSTWIWSRWKSIARQRDADVDGDAGVDASSVVRSMKAGVNHKRQASTESGLM